MAKRLVFAALVLAISAMGVAGAHDDSTTDSPRCDNWARPGHPYGHEHESGSDVNDARTVAGTEVHAQSGHYVVRNQYGYVEVVGGQSYRGPDPSGDSYEGQGGYAQGEIDPGSGAPDADFHGDVFGPDDGDLPPGEDPVQFVTETKSHACVNGAGQQVAQETP